MHTCRNKDIEAPPSHPVLANANVNMNTPYRVLGGIGCVVLCPSEAARTLLVLTGPGRLRIGGRGGGEADWTGARSSAGSVLW
jgi:hypothetical protein